MIAYASVTGSSRNKQAIEAAGWHWLFTPGAARDGYTPYALDNGAWRAFKAKQALDLVAFQRMLDRFGQNAEFIILPDIVGEGERSLELTLEWLPKCRGHRQLLIAVQNGIEPAMIAPYLAPDVGIFLGGDTDWKLETGAQWGKLAEKHDVYFHVGRVNTAQRIIWCSQIGADSFDGTSASRYSKTVKSLCNAMKQPSILRLASEVML